MIFSDKLKKIFLINIFRTSGTHLIEFCMLYPKQFTENFKLKIMAVGLVQIRTSLIREGLPEQSFDQNPSVTGNPLQNSDGVKTMFPI